MPNEPVNRSSRNHAKLPSVIQFLEALWEAGDVREIRIPKANRYGHTAAGWFDDPSLLAKAAISWDGRANIFITLNPVHSDLLARANNRVLSRADQTSADDHVVVRRWLFVDVDPRRVSGVSSTDIELAAAEETTHAIQAFFAQRSWPAPLVAMSGNGYYLLYPVDLPNSSESTDLIARLLQRLDETFSDIRVHVDISVSNAARLVGLVGSLKVKGDETLDRPHRRSKLLASPETHVRLRETDIEAVLTELEPRRPDPQDEETMPQVAATTRFVVEDALRQAGIEYRTQPPDQRGTTWYHVRRCPFHEDGRDFECGVGQKLPIGPAAGKCFHPEGQGKGWQEWKTALGLAGHFRTANGSGGQRPRLKLTDLGNAERIVRDHGDGLRHCRLHSTWYFWSGRRWSPDNSGEAERRAKETVRGIYREAYAEDSEDFREKIAKHAIKSESNRAMQAMLARAEVEAQLAIEPAKFDADPWLFNCLNGTLDLRTGRLRPHARNDMLTKLAPINFDPNTRDERWERFLLEACGGDVDFVGFLQTFFGYGLTGDTSEEKIAFLHGDGGTGKSTFIEAVKAAMGDYAMTAEFESFLARKNPGGPRPDIARLAGARLVVASETDEGRHLATGILKQLTGGDTVTARMLFSKDFEFVPQFKLVLVANAAPKVKAADTEARRRLLRLPFGHRVPDDKQDRELKRYLKTTGRAAVLAWLAEGCRRWQLEGLPIPAAVRHATEQYQRDSDELADFFEDALVFEQDEKTLSGDLHSAYRRWSSINGVSEPVSAQVMAAALEGRGCIRSRGAHGVRGWIGFRLTEGQF